MRALVTGGAGFIGSHTVDLLVRHGWQVRVVDALTTPVHVDGAIPDYIPKHVDFVRGDTRDRAMWTEALKGIDVVFHLAAYQDYLPDFSTFVHANAVSTALLYEVIVAEGYTIRKVILASSQAVYGEGKYRCLGRCAEGTAGGALPLRFPRMREEPQLGRGHWDPACPVCGSAMMPDLTDESVVNPHNAYAISKYAQELIALNLGRRYGVPTVCLRYSIVQGARQSFRNAYSGILRVFTQRLLTGRPPVCYEDGQQLRDYVSVHDVARANVLALESDRTDFESFNVGGIRPVTVLEYASLLAKRIGIEIAPDIPGVYRVGDVRHIISDSSRLMALGWRPLVSLEEIMDEYFVWAKSQPGFGDYYAEAAAQMQAVGAIKPATALSPG